MYLKGSTSTINSVLKLQTRRQLVIFLKMGYVNAVQKTDSEESSLNKASLLVIDAMGDQSRELVSSCQKVAKNETLFTSILATWVGYK